MSPPLGAGQVAQPVQVGNRDLPLHDRRQPPAEPGSNHDRSLSNVNATRSPRLTKTQTSVLTIPGLIHINRWPLRLRDFRALEGDQRWQRRGAPETSGEERKP